MALSSKAFSWVIRKRSNLWWLPPSFAILYANLWDPMLRITKYASTLPSNDIILFVSYNARSWKNKATDTIYKARSTVTNYGIPHAAYLSVQTCQVQHSYCRSYVIRSRRVCQCLVEVQHGKGAVRVR
jgi:hypothetical protein